MEVKTFTSLESSFLSKFNEGFRSFDELKSQLSMSEKTLNGIIETLLAKNVIKFDTKEKVYKYDTPVTGDKVILDGNIMLPTSILRVINNDKPEESHILVSRGEWYKFSLDFDIRRIIWNVKLPSTSKSTLMSLIQDSVMKERKSKLVQVKEYQQLVNKIIPWSNKVLLHLNVIGETQTDVTLIFVDYLKMENSNDTVAFRGLRCRSEISTTELITELRAPIATRNYGNISLSRIFNFTDFVFSKNQIPYMNDGDSINFAEITAIKGKFELTYQRFNNTGMVDKIAVDEYIDAGEGIEKLREHFNAYANALIQQSDILVEMAD